VSDINVYYLDVRQTCPDCHGYGFVSVPDWRVLDTGGRPMNWITSKCLRCGGSGWVPTEWKGAQGDER
jgi:DnaJ-class molecular chaperone